MVTVFRSNHCSVTRLCKEFGFLPLIARALSSSSSSSSSSNFGNSPFHYGDSNISTLRVIDKSFFVDKTQFLPLLLDPKVKHISVFRPPRFGKTLMLETVNALCDIGKSETERAELFRGLDVWEKEEFKVFREAHAGKYHILHFNFGGIVADERFAQSFDGDIKCTILLAAQRYELELLKVGEATSYLTDFARRVNAKGGKLLILIDEYDQAANALMAKDRDQYRKSTKNGTALLLSMGSFFSTIKTISNIVGTHSITTGISPIALLDASGFNVCKDMTLNPKFGDVFGFFEDDLKRAIAYFPFDTNVQEFTLEIMKYYFNGYYFVGSSQKVYNPQLCINFMYNMYRYPQVCSLVMEMAATYKEIKNDSNELSRLLASIGTKLNLDDDNIKFGTVAMDTLQPVHDKVLPMVLKLLGSDAGDGIHTNLFKRFKIEELLSVRSQAATESLIASYLLYHGAATLSDPKLSDDLQCTTRCPNAIVKKQFIDAILARILADKTVDSNLTLFLETPTPDNLIELLEASITNEDRYFFWNVHYGEPFLSMGLRHLWNKGLGKDSDWKVNSEVTLQSMKRLDVQFTNEKLHKKIVIELKRLRPNAVLFHNQYYDCDDTKNGEEFFKKMVAIKSNSAELLQLPINPNFRPLCKHASNVQELLTNAQEQAKIYNNGVFAKEKYCFGVVQVGVNRFAVGGE